MNSAAEAFDAAFASDACDFVLSDGHVEPLDLTMWSGTADSSDHELFIDHCDGPTIDVGCGPGRLVEALAERQIAVLGIDVSTAAIDMTRARGGAAVLRDVFEHLPGEGLWNYAILADGNIGIGGDPVRLLRRLGALLHDDGTVLVEVRRTPVGLRCERRRLRVGSVVSAEFDWAVVGSDAIASIALQAGWRIAGTYDHRSRRVVALKRLG